MITTVSERDLDFAREIGADQAIDYKNQSFEDIVGQVDLVFDLVDGETRARSWQVIKPGGALITALSEPSQEEAQKHQVRASRYMAHPDGAQLREIASLIDRNKVRPVIDKVFPIQNIAQAQSRIQQGGFRGKLVMRL